SPPGKAQKLPAVGGEARGMSQCLECPFPVFLKPGAALGKLWNEKGRKLQGKSQPER
ncbi:unnamed protein product, partial [Coccothraustes coccothraustes]